VLAEDEARGLRHQYIATDHLLVALLGEEDTPAARMLADAGATIGEARVRAAEIGGPGVANGAARIPFTTTVKAVFRRANEESLAFGHPSVGTEHLLLGLALEPDGPAALVLERLGIERDELAEVVVAGFGGWGRRGELPPPPVGPDPVRRLLSQAKDVAVDAQRFELAAAIRDLERGVTSGAETALGPAQPPRPGYAPLPNVVYERVVSRREVALAGAGGVVGGLVLGWLLWG
jgi:hypothetical protein